MNPTLHPGRQRGTTLIEVLVTLVIVAFGLLGIGALQAKMQLGTIEAYQRAQAVVLLEDMSARINANKANAGTYVLANPAGTGDSQPDDCTGMAAGAPRDICEWSAALKGAAEVKSGTKVGAMVGARGCIEQIQAPDTTTGVCQPGIYQVSVAWQGLHLTSASALTCGSGLYGADGNRRAISVRITVGLPACT
ncbi:type IV pilus modification PilV family protein [Pseudoduganella ginsengisoli]|uniref:Prepilin-type N-terminal cleavage/methylation domain-containing protein n=1 Tax=Pseudoduganella ginsengisoli TaxID=1462440 RepID=A0A6L6Q848_9BURK|nr:prepilin-type N-terminal cleavage/methylation domain-containing protein [Pseudoduganella ginsengisoli]MTW05765.1 prepilin-type N-terminal cleavage/methylation domain-containing protein [Pseudoduganella ginsengisoli]